MEDISIKNFFNENGLIVIEFKMGFQKQKPKITTYKV